MESRKLIPVYDCVYECGENSFVFSMENYVLMKSFEDFTSINVNTTTNVNITISFEQVREKIEDMTALSQKETDEAIEKVNELEAISKENISRKSKWEKVKPIIAFAMDKGADLGIAILTLIVQMKLGM